MTPLRSKYIRDLAIRGKAERTQHSYTAYVADLARHFSKSPDLLSYEQVADWIYYLIKERKLAPSSVNIAVNAVRFLYGTTLGRPLEELYARIPRVKRSTKRAHAYAVEEVEVILTAPARLRDRAFLTTVYAGGFRLMEACTLRAREGIDRARMQLRVDGKGAKERIVPLSARLLALLEDYWREERRGSPGSDVPWLFLGADQQGHMCKATGQNIYYRAVKKSGVPRKGGIHVLRHSFATHLIESGVEITLVQRLLGHTSLATTSRYLHVTAKRLERVHCALDLIDTSALNNR
jgi:integrase/recombinase XerD